MSDLNNPKNIIGMGDILVDEDEDINIDEIEKSITSGINIKKKEEKNIDIAKQYSKDIEELSRRFNLNNRDMNDANDDDSDDESPETNVNWAPYNKPVNNTSTIQQSTNYKAPYNLADSDDDSDNDSPTQTNYRPSNDNYHPPTSWNAGRPVDEQLNRMTNEERKQEHISRVLGNMEKNNDDAAFVQKEDEEDEMAILIEQIDLLRTNLESEGIDLSRIPNIDASSSKKEAKAVFKILQIKNDRARYCDFFNEGILAVAYGLESIFDGKRDVFGSKIDLTGYSDTVKVKLRRMRYDTSNFVSGIMQGYNINSGWRIILELLPSLFLYSRNRRLTGTDNLISDENYKKAMQDLQ
jgi:hypothetical protein